MMNLRKSNKSTTSKAPKIATVIGKGTEITGDVRFEGGLHIDGRVVGNILADDDANTTLTVSELGHIEGDIRVPNVILNGEVEGNVYASARVELAAKANVHGTVYYRFLEMQMGSVVNGQLIRTEDEQARMLTHDGEGDKKKGAAAPAQGNKAAAGNKPAAPAQGNKPAAPAQGNKPAAGKPTQGGGAS